MHEYEFDVTLLSSVRVKADTQAEAEKIIHAALNYAELGLGADHSVMPTSIHVTIEGELDLAAIDGDGA